MLTIRLQRTGKKNQADFRIVLAEKQAPVTKKFVEVLGSYNPRKKNFQVKEERVKYWISQHVEISPTVHNLFVTKNLLDAKKVKAFNTPKKPVEPAVADTTPAAEAATLSNLGGEQTSAAPAAESSQPAPAETPASEAPASTETPTESTPASEETPAA